MCKGVSQIIIGPPESPLVFESGAGALVQGGRSDDFDMHGRFLRQTQELGQGADVCPGRVDVMRKPLACSMPLLLPFEFL